MKEFNLQEHKTKALEARAEAQLIAAAPDLLEALQELLDVDRFDTNKVIESENKAIAAINKALNK